MKFEIKNADNEIIPNLAILGFETEKTTSVIKVIIIIKNCLVHRVFYDKYLWEQDVGQSIVCTTNEIIPFNSNLEEISSFIERINSMSFFMEVTNHIVFNETFTRYNKEDLSN